MISSGWQSWFAAGGEKHREPDPEDSIKRLKEYEKNKNRLMDTGAHVLYELAALDPDDCYIEELRQQEIMRINQESVVAGADMCGPFFHNEPPKNSLLTNQPSIWAGSMLFTRQHLPFPLDKSASGTAITGLPGCGKTTLAMILAIQWVLASTLVIVWDLKRTWRKLSYLPFFADKVIILSIMDFFWSLLQPPPGTTAHEWANRLTKVFSQAYSRISAQRVLREIIDKLQAVCPPNFWSTPQMWIDALKAMRATSSRDREYITSLLWAISDLTLHLPCFNFVSSNFPQCLIDQPGRLVVVEDIGLPIQHWNFVISLLLEYIFTYRLNNPGRCDFDIVAVLEDCTSLLDVGQDQATPGGVSLLAQHLNLSREVRTGIVVPCHSLSQISPKICCNIENYFCCSLRGDDTRVAQQVLGLTPEAASYLRVNPRGTACALVPSIWPLPLMIEFPPIMEHLK
jgi:hypothetical protein